MSDPHTLEIFKEIRNALWDHLEPVGSPAYVRRLRDQAVMQILANPRPDDVEQARVVAKNNKGDFEGAVRATLALWAVELADAGIYALGYDPPGDPPGEPGKEG